MSAARGHGDDGRVEARPDQFDFFLKVTTIVLAALNTALDSLAAENAVLKAL